MWNEMWPHVQNPSLVSLGRVKSVFDEKEKE